jgi:hypothetical protein
MSATLDTNPGMARRRMATSTARPTVERQDREVATDRSKPGGEDADDADEGHGHEDGRHGGHEQQRGVSEDRPTTARQQRQDPAIATGHGGDRHAV